VAVLAKACRNALIGFVALGYALYWARKGQAAVISNKATFLWAKFPKFVLRFLLISLLASIVFFTRPQIAAIGNLSRWAFLLSFAGVGLRTNLRELGKQEIRRSSWALSAKWQSRLLRLGSSSGRLSSCNSSRVAK
jgi:uncharacterized membrane protein YadS